LTRTRTLALAVVLVLSAVLAFPGLPVHAAEGRTAYLVRDLDPREESESGGPAVVIGTVGNRVLLKSSDTASGDELWASDGTPLGTQMLVDVCPGPCSSEVRVLGSLNGRTFWVGVPAPPPFGTLDERRRRLWVTDGTRTGTIPLSEEGIPASVALTRDALYFTGCREFTFQCDLWRSDGTPEGTVLIRQFTIDQGTPGALTAVGSRVFFVANRDLWVTDGTAPGTVRLKSFSRSTPEGLTAAGNRLFLAADDGQGTEVWTSDATVPGTRALTQLAPASPFPTLADHFEPWLFKVAGNLVFFLVNDVTHEDELWRSDGTPAGTFAVTDFSDHQPFGDERLEIHFGAAGNRFLFEASDGLSPTRLWVSTGTRQSTHPLADECPTCSLPHIAGFSGLIETGSRVVFSGQVASESETVWTSDGTARGTIPVDVSCGGSPCGTLFADPVASSGGAFFTLGAHSVLDLWFTDGTANGTHRLTAFRQNDFSTVRADANRRTPDGRFFFTVRGRDFSELWVSRGTPATSRSVGIGRAFGRSSAPSQLTPFGERLFFVGCGPDIGIWQTAGTAATTLPVSTEETTLFCDGTFGPDGLVVAGGTAFFFTRDDSGGWQLWRTVEPAGRVRLLDSEVHSEVTGRAAVLGGRLYFEVHTNPPYQSEVWRSDGTPQGTVKVLELPDVTLRHMTAVGDELYLIATDRRIWRSDGTEAGTREILNTGVSFASFADEPLFARLGSRVFLTALGSGQHAEVWEIDGTTMHRVAEVPELSTDNTQPWGLTAHQGALYFFARQGGRAELWRSDGTQFGTLRLGSFTDPGFIRSLMRLTPFAGALYFAADGGQEGEELWKTDGTAAGTVLVRDIAPGGDSSSPSSLTVAGGRLYFAATESIHGRELWESDGTAAGTRLVQDIAPLASSSAPADLTVAGDRLYFTADDSLTGRELWALPLAGATGCQPSPTHLCLGNGRFQAEIAWRDFQGNTGTGTAVPLTGDTGYFWFFDPANVEAVVKVLDGRGLNGHQWVFYGALSNVEYTLTVTDTQTGLTRRYFNPSGVFASVGDTQGFGPLGAFSTAPAPPLAEERPDPAAAGTCQAGAQRLCLNHNRFAVEVTWKDFQGHTGQGQAVPLSGDTGYFWFFDAANVELVTKALDGTALNGKFWFFYGALSNVEYKITVTDTVTGKMKTYVNPSGHFGSVGDTAAF
jgi:ELWxxDGT repeat protein